jgi:hypothetical protein
MSPSSEAYAKEQWPSGTTRPREGAYSEYLD